MKSFGVVYCFSCWYTNLFSHFCFFLLDKLKIFLRALVSNSLVSCLKWGSMVQIVESMDPVQLFQCMEVQKGNHGQQSFLNLHHIMFQCWFVWNQTRFGSSQNANHTFLFIMANFEYSCTPYSCIGSLWRSLVYEHHIRHSIYSVFLYGGQPWIFQQFFFNEIRFGFMYLAQIKIVVISRYVVVVQIFLFRFYFCVFFIFAHFSLIFLFR